MNRSRRILMAMGLLAVISVGGWAWAQAKSKPRDPLAMVPAASILLIHADGDLLHQAAWEKTAAYDAFRKSGLLDAVSKLLHDIVDNVPDEKAHAVMEILEFVSANGMTASVGLPPGDGPALPYLTAVVRNAGPHEGVLDQFVGALGSDVELVREKVSGRQVSRFMIPQTPGAEVAWWAEGEHLVFTVGLGAVDAAMQVLDGKSANFAASAQGKKLATNPGFDRTGLFLLDLAVLRNRFGKFPLPQPDPEKTVNFVLKSIGLESLNSVVVQSGYKGRALWSTIDVDAPGPRKGLMGLADGDATMSLADLPPLPVNHVGFHAQSVSLARTYDQVLELVKSAVSLGPPEIGEQVDDFISRIPELLGCDVRNEILAQLGTVQCLYSDSSQGGLLGADHGLVLQVKDPARLRTAIKKLLLRLENEVPGEIAATVHRDKSRQTLTTVKIGGGAFNPTFMIGEKWLCVGLSSQTVEAFALRLKGDLPSWKPDAETTEVLAAVPKKFSAISIAYPRPMMRGLISATPFLMGLAQGGVNQASKLGVFPRIEMSTSPLEIPPAELVIQPLFPNVAWTIVDETGIHCTTRSSAPAVPLVGGADGSTVAVGAVLVALLLPAVQQAREAARRTQSKNNLKLINLGLMNFHDTYNHYPSGTIPSQKLKPEQRQSWLVSMLPYLDNAAMYNEMNVNGMDSAPWDEERLKEFNAVKLSALTNPSQKSESREGEAATTDYVGWAGVGKDAMLETCKPEKKGIFGYDRRTRLQDISDGASNTIIVSDVVGDSRGPWAQGGHSTIRALTRQPYVNGPDGIGSPHAGGFNAALADGAVRFISNKIDPTVMEALATRAGGEPLGDF